MKAMEAVHGGWYLGDQGFKDKVVRLINKTGAETRQRGSFAATAVRAHHKNEAQYINHIVHTEMEQPLSAA